jgi:hypothetical protein
MFIRFIWLPMFYVYCPWFQTYLVSAEYALDLTEIRILVPVWVSQGSQLTVHQPLSHSAGAITSLLLIVLLHMCNLEARS